MKLTFTLTIDTDSADDAVIRQQTARLAASDKSLADAVAGAGSHTTPHEGKNMAKKAAPTGNPTIDALIAQVDQDQTVIGSAVTLINGIAAQITAAVNAALAGGATAAQLAPLTDLTTSLAAADQALATAVANNTPAGP